MPNDSVKIRTGRSFDALRLLRMTTDMIPAPFVQAVRAMFRRTPLNRRSRDDIRMPCLYRGLKPPANMMTSLRDVTAGGRAGTPGARPPSRGYAYPAGGLAR